MANGDDITAQAADGSLHVFPAGTDVSVIDTAMKRYAAPRQAGAMQAKPGGPVFNAANPPQTPNRGFAGTVVDKLKDAIQSILTDPTGGRPLSDPRAWLNVSAETPPMVREATRPLPANLPTDILGGRGTPGAGTVGRGIYRAATTLSPLVPFLNPEAMEKASAKGDTGAVAAEAAVPTAAALAPMAMKAAGRGGPGVMREIVGEGASKMRVLADQHARALEVQKHVAGVADAVHTDAQQAMAQVSQAVDAAKPNGVFDRGDVGSRLDSAIGDIVSDRSQLPKPIQKLLPKEVEGKQVGPTIGGKALDLSKPEDMAAYNRYKAAGAFTPEEVAKYEGKSTGMMSFEDLKQARSDLGAQLGRLQGSAKAAADAAYSELSKMLREGARGANAEPDWIDANARYKNYVDDFIRSPIKKVLEGENAPDIMDAITGKSRIQAMQILQKYEPFGLDLSRVSHEARAFGIGDTTLKASRPGKWDLVLAGISPKAAMLRQLAPRYFRNPNVIHSIAGGEGFEPKTIAPSKVYPSQKAAAAAAKKGNPVSFTPPHPEYATSPPGSPAYNQINSWAERAAKGDDVAINALRSIASQTMDLQDARFAQQKLDALKKKP